MRGQDARRGAGKVRDCSVRERVLRSGGQDGVDDGADDDGVSDHQGVEQAADFLVVSAGEEGALWGDDHEVCGGPERRGGDGRL